MHRWKFPFQKIPISISVDGGTEGGAEGGNAGGGGDGSAVYAIEQQ